jgi:hypothetical protein
MCSTRSSSVSTWPYIIVAVVDMPSRCAWRMTPSHSRLRLLRRDDVADAVDEDLGAAAGIESRPASRSRVSVAGTVSFERRAMCWISGGDSACRWIG